MDSVPAPITEDQLRIVPANQASWKDLAAVFGTAYPARCGCQRFKLGDRRRSSMPPEDLAARFREQTRCGEPAGETSGLVAYIDDEPAGWAAVEPRTAYSQLLRNPMPWRGRDEDKLDDTIWAVTCFVIRKGYRKRGLAYALARAAIDHARGRGARALEAYPMEVPPGTEITWDELRVGPVQVFEDAGFVEVSHPTKRRVVMRVDF